MRCTWVLRGANKKSEEKTKNLLRFGERAREIEKLSTMALVDPVFRSIHHCSASFRIKWKSAIPAGMTVVLGDGKLVDR
jgi:hypothetical protein